MSGDCFYYYRSGVRGCKFDLVLDTSCFCSSRIMSSRALADENGNKDQTREYPNRDPFRDYPYGKTEYSYGDKTEYQFGGKELYETGLYYFGARYYQSEARPLWGDPNLGRWLTCDPAGQGWSPYGYCGGNPVIYVDPDGEWFIVAAIAAQAIWNAYQYYENSGGDWNAAFAGLVQGAVIGGISAGFGIGLSEVLGWAATAGTGINFATYTLGGGLIGGISNAAHGKDFFQGFGIGMVAGATTWAGGYLATKEFFGSGMLGNLVSSGGISVLENISHGDKWNSSYTTYFGPLSITLSESDKPRYGISSLTSLIASGVYAYKSVKGDLSLNLLSSISSGTLVFEGGSKGGETWGNVIRISSFDDPTIQAALYSYKVKSIIGHEMIHVFQHRLFRSISIGSDYFILLYSEYAMSGNYFNNPFEIIAFNYGF